MHYHIFKSMDPKEHSAKGIKIIFNLQMSLLGGMKKLLVAWKIEKLYVF